MTGSIELVPVTLASAFIGGVVLALMASIRLPLARRLGVAEGRAAVFAAALNLALVPAMLLSGILIDHWGVEWVLIGGSLLTAIAVALVALSQNYASSRGAILAVAAASACILVGSSVLMPRALFPSNPIAAMNLGTSLVVLGTLAAPVASEISIRHYGFRRTLGLMALLCLVPALIAALTPAQEFPTFGSSPTVDVLGNPFLWLAGLAFFFYGPLESMVGTWASAYLAELGFAERRAAWLVSGFWLVFLTARLLAAFLLERGWVPERTEMIWLILLPALAAAIALGNLGGATNRTSAAWGMFLVALFLGPILPTLAGIVYRHFPEDAGTSLGAAYSSAALGSLVLIPAIGLYARRTTVRKALYIPAVVGLLLSATVLVLHLLPKRW